MLDFFDEKFFSFFLKKNFSLASPYQPCILFFPVLSNQRSPDLVYLSRFCQLEPTADLSATLEADPGVPSLCV